MGSLNTQAGQSILKYLKRKNRKQIKQKMRIPIKYIKIVTWQAC